MKKPKAGECAPFLEFYISKVPKGALLTHYRKSMKETQTLMAGLSDAQGNYAYAEGKWSVKALLMHMIDTERIWCFRILAWMRGDRAALPGFNQDHYMEQVQVADRTVADLMKEWKAVRENTLFLFKQCTEEQSRFVGQASGFKCTPRALFYSIAGHHYHHLEVYKQAYLPGIEAMGR